MEENLQKKKNNPLSPRDFMRGRRPQKFSDSFITIQSRLNRSLLEYHLNSLSNRKQEKDFEDFARKLCQYEFCPNLRPQTGSTGGGDSKVDSENLPVVSQLQVNFHYGVDNQTKERLAFAFSIQKDWRSKVKNDVQEIVNTKRNYSHIIFVTSQFTRDKTRAKVEDELSDKYEVRVTIVDRTWILDTVFQNKREKLAIEELEMGVGLEEKIEVGPLDYKRKKQLEDWNDSIQEDINCSHITIETVDDCLKAAITAAELELPRQETDGFFDRAIRFAKEYGFYDQYFTALYQKTWVTFFWFEDYISFIQSYEQVENEALKSKNIFCIERLHNIWTLLFTLASTSNLISKDKVIEKAEILNKKLEQFIIDETNISSGIQAEAIQCFINLTVNIEDQIKVNEIFEKLIKIIDKASDLIGFPFESTFQIFNESNDIFSGFIKYEKLQDHLVDFVTKREGDISAGKILLNRGIQHAKAKRTYKAIDFLGRALKRFYKKESKDLLVRTLLLLSMQYEDVGLLWAARASLLNAASHATSDLWVYSRVNTLQLACYEQLKYLELRLGRIGYALEWHTLHRLLASQLSKSEEENNKLLDKSLYFGSVMGLLLIKSNEEELNALESLPDVLMEMDLDFAALGLIYRLGGKESLPKAFIESPNINDTEEFFNSYLTQPAQEFLPDRPEYYMTENCVLNSSILGCNFKIITPNSSPEIEVAEYILGAIESLLSTTMPLHAVSRDSEVVINIYRDENLKIELKYENRKDGKLGIIVKNGLFNPHSLSLNSQKIVASNISEIVCNLVANTIIFKDPKTDLLQLFKNEEVSDRAFSFSGPMVVLGNVLGYNPKRNIKDWLDPKATVYKYSKEKSWEPKINKILKIDKEQEIDIDDINAAVSHRKVKNVSIIRAHLWDQAEWQGLFYLTSEVYPPVISLMFGNEEKAKAIFENWKESFGDIDSEEIIRLSILRGISVKNPSWYRAVITTNIEKIQKPNNLFILISRVHTLTPESDENLNRFVDNLKKYGKYLLAPAYIKSKQDQPKVFYELGIEKKVFNDRNAWEIGLNDIDLSGITIDTEPIIPSSVPNPPVLEVIKKLKDRK